MISDDVIVFILVAILLTVFTVFMFQISIYLGILTIILSLGFWITFLGVIGIL